MRTVTFSEARDRLKDVLDRVADDADFTIITRRDAADAVVMSLETFNSWRETLHLLSNPANAKHLLASIAELDAKRGKSRRLLEPGAQPRLSEPRARYAAKERGDAQPRGRKVGKRG